MAHHGPGPDRYEEPKSPPNHKDRTLLDDTATLKENRNVANYAAGGAVQINRADAEWNGRSAPCALWFLSRLDGDGGRFLQLLERVLKTFHAGNSPLRYSDGCSCQHRNRISNQEK